MVCGYMEHEYGFDEPDEEEENIERVQNGIRIEEVDHWDVGVGESGQDVWYD